MSVAQAVAYTDPGLGLHRRREPVGTGRRDPIWNAAENRDSGTGEPSHFAGGSLDSRVTRSGGACGRLGLLRTRYGH